MRLEFGVFMESCCLEDDIITADAVTGRSGNIVAALPANMMNDDILEAIGKTLGRGVEASGETVSTYGVGFPEVPLTARADLLLRRAMAGALAVFALQDVMTSALLAMNSGSWTDRGEIVLETRAKHVGLDAVRRKAHLHAGDSRNGELVLHASEFYTDESYGVPWRP